MALWFVDKLAQQMEEILILANEECLEVDGQNSRQFTSFELALFICCFSTTVHDGYKSQLQQFNLLLDLMNG